jgi:cysteine-rich repeat protein
MMRTQFGWALALGLALSACGNNGNNAACGDGVTDAGEQCDDGNNVDGDGCQADCALPICGDGVIDAGEACDDGNNVDGDECPANCQLDVERACPIFATDFDRVCVPLNGDPALINEVPAGQGCGAGFFNVNDIDVRRVADDLLILKETGDGSGERPIMALFLGTDTALMYDTGNGSIDPFDVVTPLIGNRSLQVFNTHLHGDHTTFNEFVDNDPNVFMIAISTPEVDDHCNVGAFDANQAAVCNNNADYFPPQIQTLGFGSDRFRVSEVVRDGHLIDLGNGLVIEVLATPGHAETSVTLHDRKHRILFTGDTLYPGFNPPLVHPVGSSFSAYLDTAERYAALEPVLDFVIGAHDQGTMPRTALSRFLAAVQASDPNDNDVDFVDPACASGTFSFINFPDAP